MERAYLCCTSWLDTNTDLTPNLWRHVHSLRISRAMRRFHYLSISLLGFPQLGTYSVCVLYFIVWFNLKVFH
ncbi:hypothetical protein ACN38_g7040 [Penicillium nordicum]|uniref:Uncharacterized protein n=1 Tax=Penicillium nordicum TaxID=229535 RepID=A0A0M8NZL3_9EURO|nr:hypothetical protein ACN38_g7040 [Penicillium nordicum]